MESFDSGLDAENTSEFEVLDKSKLKTATELGSELYGEASLGRVKLTVHSVESAFRKMVKHVLEEKPDAFTYQLVSGRRYFHPKDFPHLKALFVTQNKIHFSDELIEACENFLKDGTPIIYPNSSTQAEQPKGSQEQQNTEFELPEESESKHIARIVDDLCALLKPGKEVSYAGLRSTISVFLKENSKTFKAKKSGIHRYYKAKDVLKIKAQFVTKYGSFYFRPEVVAAYTRFLTKEVTNTSTSQSKSPDDTEVFVPKEFVKKTPSVIAMDLYRQVSQKKMSLSGFGSTVMKFIREEVEFEFEEMPGGIKYYQPHDVLQIKARFVTKYGKFYFSPEVIAAYQAALDPKS